MRILHIWENYCPGLFDRSHHLCSVGGLYSEIVCQSLIYDGISPDKNIYTNRQITPFEFNRTSLLKRLIRLVLLWRNNVLFCQLVAKRSRVICPDFVHVHFGTTAAILALYNQLPNVNFIVSFYGVDISQSLKDKRIVKLYSQIFDRASILHVLCQEAKSRLLDAGCASHKIRVSNLPIDLNQIPKLAFSPAQTTRFLIAARFVEKKGHSILLAAFQRLISDGADVKLTCFGYGPSKWLKLKIYNLGLSDHVNLIDNKLTPDFLSDYLQLLQEHDVVVAPSLRARNGDDEGGPALTVIIAQAAARPVIVSNFPGSELSVTNNVEGNVVQMNSIDNLYSAMYDLIANKQKWLGYGEAGRTRVNNEFSDSAFWTFLKECYGVC